MSRKVIEIKIPAKATVERAAPVRDLDTWLEPTPLRTDAVDPAPVALPSRKPPGDAAQPARPEATPAPAWPAVALESISSPLMDSVWNVARINLRGAQALMQARTLGEFATAQTHLLRSHMGGLLIGFGLFAEGAGQALVSTGRTLLGAGRD